MPHSLLEKFKIDADQDFSKRNFLLMGHGSASNQNWRSEKMSCPLKTFQLS